LSRVPEAGIAVSDVQLIDRNGDALSEETLTAGGLSKRSAQNVLNLDRVRGAFSNQPQSRVNFRPVPHDCLLHFDGRSVYLSLNQLVVRMSAARAAGRFETATGSVADFSWLLQLTSSTGSIHVPKKLAMWRYHGNQLSLRPDLSRAGSQRAAAERAMRRISDANPILLSRNDRAALLLPLKILECRSPIG